jgi:hypothetical protein
VQHPIQDARRWIRWFGCDREDQRMRVDEMAARYEIRVNGHLPQDWSECFWGLAVTHDPNGETILRGTLPDQAALFGVVLHLRDLGLTLISVNRVESDSTTQQEHL